MPHRALKYVPRCAVCEQPTKKMCKRCGLPLCKDHLPPRDRRCDRCEADYAAREMGLPVKGGEASVTSVPHGSFATGILGSVVMGVAGVLALMYGAPLGALWVLLAVIGVFGVLLITPAWALATLAAGSAQLAGAGYAHLAHKHARKKFLKERKAPALESGTVDPSAG